MKTPLLLLLPLLAAAVYADGVAPATLKGKQVNFIYEGAVITDEAGNVLQLPTWRSRSVVFDDDTTATGSRSGTMSYTRMLPATATITDDGFSGKGYRLNGAKDSQGGWTLYFADATHGSAHFMGQEKGKDIQFRNVSFTITEPQAGEPDMLPNRQCTLVPSKETTPGAPVSLTDKEVVFSPSAEQKAAMGDYVPLDMAFGLCYRGYDSDVLYNPMVAVLIPGDKNLSWGTWRDRSSGVSELMCCPLTRRGAYSRLEDGKGVIDLMDFKFHMTFTSPASGTATFTALGANGKEVKDIPFTVKPCPRPERMPLFEPAPEALPFPGFENGVKGARFAWLDTTLVATMHRVPGKPGMVELCVFCDVNGTGKWKELSRQTAKLPGSIEDVAPMVFECEDAMHFYDLEKGKVLGKYVTIPAVSHLSEH